MPVIIIIIIIIISSSSSSSSSSSFESVLCSFLVFRFCAFVLFLCCICVLVLALKWSLVLLSLHVDKYQMNWTEFSWIIIVVTVSDDGANTVVETPAS